MFMLRMGWKAIYFNSKTNDNSSERYGLKTMKCPKQVKELVPFENDLIDTLKVIKFLKVKKHFLTELKNNIKTVKQSKKTLAFSNKTLNIYWLIKEEHGQLLSNAVASTWKRNTQLYQEEDQYGRQTNFKK